MIRIAIPVMLLTILVTTADGADPWRAQTPNTVFDWFSRPQPGGELGPIVTDRPDFTEASDGESVNLKPATLSQPTQMAALQPMSTRGVNR